MTCVLLLDDLIFVLPKFARMWNTVGGLREEKIEAFHNIGMITCKEISFIFFSTCSEQNPPDPHFCQAERSEACSDDGEVRGEAESGF